jgi:hypothetical protein
LVLDSDPICVFRVVAAIRIVDMNASNSWAEFATLFRATREAFLEHERAKNELKALMPEDAREAIGHGVRGKRSKSGAVSFDLLATTSAVKPVGIIEEMFVADLVFLEWEVLRWRRLKSSLIQTRGRRVLQNFLEPLRKDWIQDEPFPPSRLDMIREDQATKELVQAYARREPDAVTLVHKLLTDAGASMDGLMAEALAEKLDDIERIDRLTSIAESRRNASLHEIERRRAVLGETLRRSVQEIEDGEYEVIETTPAQGKNVT